MGNLLLILLGAVACIIGFVFLFFKKIRNVGLIIFIISITSILVGFEGCKNSSFIYPSQEELEEQEMAEQEEVRLWTETAENSSQEESEKLIQKEVQRIKKELSGDSLAIFKKHTDGLIKTVYLFEKELVLDMNLNNNSNYPFKSFDFEKLFRFKYQKNWINSTKYIVPIGDQLVHISGALSNDSSCIVYQGYLNLSTRTIYWTGFQPEELIVTDVNNKYSYESPNKFLELTKASPEMRVNLLYWQAQYQSKFYTKMVCSRKDQQMNSVQVEGEFIPFYKVNQIKDNGQIVLRNFYNY